MTQPDRDQQRLQTAHDACPDGIFERTRQDATLPLRKRKGDAGWDVHSLENVLIAPGAMHQFYLGVRMRLPPGWFAMIQERSSQGKQQVFTLGNIIDEGYAGEVSALVANIGATPYLVQRGDRIAQILLIPRYQSIHEDQLPSRGDGGFGSTGKQ